MNDGKKARDRNEYSLEKYSDFIFVHIKKKSKKIFMILISNDNFWSVQDKVENISLIIFSEGFNLILYFVLQLWFYMITRQIQTSEFWKYFVTTTMIVRTSAGTIWTSIRKSYWRLISCQMLILIRTSYSRALRLV